MSIERTDRNVGTILGPDGEAAQVPVEMFTDDEAKALRAYKKILLKYGLREELRCNSCFEGKRNDGLQAYVTADRIVFRCRCRMRSYIGGTA